jgi:hypothetical protein
MKKQEIFEKIKSIFNHKFIKNLYGIDITNLEEYLHSINIEKNTENEYDDNDIQRIHLFLKFIHYLKKNSTGDIDSIINVFENIDYKEYKGYVTVRKILTEGVEFLRFNIDNTRFFAEWIKEGNYGIWENYGHSNIEYDGYLLFPTKKPEMYFCLAYKLK